MPEYPQKYWWLVLVLVPLTAALIAVLPSFTGHSDKTPAGKSDKTACSFSLGSTIFNKWNQYGGQAGFLGCPLMDEAKVLPSLQGTKGRWAIFVGLGDFERGYIFLHETGKYAGYAFEVHGAIGRLYNRMNKSASWLGFPVSDEYDMPSGIKGRRSDFEGGYIAWNPQTRDYEPYHY